MAKIPEQQYERFDLTFVVEQTKTLLGEKVQLHFSSQQTCFGDPQLLAHVLINHVKNALEEKDAIVEVQCYLSNSQQYLIVTDNGTGTGIGLALVESFVSKKDGKLTLANCASIGAKVELRWPLQY